MIRLLRLAAVAVLSILCTPLIAGQAASETVPASGASRDAAASEQDDTATRLLRGVGSIASPGIPGSIATWGDPRAPERSPARALICGKVERDLLAPVVAYSSLGKGRIVAFGHSGYGEAATLAHEGTARLMRNAIAWVGKSSGDQAVGAPDSGADIPADAPRKPLRIGLHAGDAKTAAWLAFSGDEVRALEGRDWPSQLEHIDVLFLFTPSLTDGQVLAIGAFIKRGGGLIAAQTGWGWKQLSGDKPMRENKLNQLLGEAGLAWTDETVDDTSPDGFDAASPPPALASGAAALGLILGPAAPSPAPAAPAQPKGQPAARPAASKSPSTVAPAERDMRQAAATAMRAARSLPPGESALRSRLDSLVKSSGQELVPRAKAPLGRKNARARFLLAYQIEQMEQSDQGAEALPDGHPAAADFPGAVPATVARVSREVSIDLRIPGRHSLGLYAPPGARVSVRAPRALAAAEVGGISIRIGAHSDQLWHAEKWSRVPEITTTRALAAGDATEVTSPFGGLCYIEVSDARARRAKPGDTLALTIEGCVPSPLFVLGKTPVSDWAKTLAESEAPWAELATSKVILTVPTAELRTAAPEGQPLADPTALMQFWDQVLDHAADLAAIPRERRRPERYVADVQISAGYMHSGYPIMTHLDAASHMVSLERMQRGAWGLFHELGHNHQERDWTFEGTGEVTCNLFALYISQRLCRIPDSAAHDALKDPSVYVGPYLARPDASGKGAIVGGTKSKFEHWKANPFLALQMYRQLAAEFGWETYTKVFAEYRGLKPDERPKGEEQERDQWMVRFSRACGRNLGPFFEAWGVPTSEAARASIAELPVWMPVRLEEISSFVPAE